MDSVDLFHLLLKYLGSGWLGVALALLGTLLGGGLYGWLKKLAVDQAARDTERNAEEEAARIVRENLKVEKGWKPPVVDVSQGKEERPTRGNY